MPAGFSSTHTSAPSYGGPPIPTKGPAHRPCETNSARYSTSSSTVCDQRKAGSSPRAHGSLGAVFVVAAVPDSIFVAAERRAVEPLVHAPEDIDPALVCRVGVVDGAVVEGERAHAGPFAPVGLPAGAEGRLTPGVPGEIGRAHV